MIRRNLMTGTLLLALAACGGAGSNNAAGNAANAAAPAANDSAAANEQGQVQDGPRVLLTGTGILPDGANAPEIRFGASRADTMAAATRTLGRERAMNMVEDCGGSGAAQAADFGALVLFFQQDRFVGWEQREASERPWIGTPGGASVGARRPTLATALGGPIEVEQSTLGTEFSRGDISGLLASANADAQVDRLWGGNNCAMR